MDTRNYHGKSSQKNIKQGACYRITVLTDRLIRLEFDESGLFEDRPSQFAVNRDFDAPDYTVLETEDNLELHTRFLSL